MKVKIFCGHFQSLQDQVNKWLESEENEIFKVAQSSSEGMVIITIFYRKAE